MPDEPAITSMMDAAARLEADLACTACGYNLRGLRRDGACGECGSPVEWTLRGYLSFGGDLDWLAGVNRATAALAMLTPWFWVPLLWPLFSWHGFRLAARQPAAGIAEGITQRRLIRPLLLVMPVGTASVALFTLFVWLQSTYTPIRLRSDSAQLLLAARVTYACWLLFQFLLSFAVMRIATLSRSRWLRRLSGVAQVCSMLAPFGVACEIFEIVGERNESLLVLAGNFGVSLGLLGWLLISIVLHRLWRIVSSAFAGAREARRSPGVWRIRAPGSSFIANS